MVINKGKKIRKLRGSRTHGWGSPKKHRGAGSRGGRGNAGSGKKGQQKMSKLHNIKQRIGKSGFNRPKILIKKDIIINLSEINEKLNDFMDKKIAVKTKAGLEIELSKAGYTKVLGSGDISEKMIIKCRNFSKRATEKIKSKGGNIINE